jgi:1-acyl-sn-glycerol-3-phosphate acyltransferase
VFDTLYVLWKTLAISLPTVIDAQRGRLRPETVDARLKGWAAQVLARTQVTLDVQGESGPPGGPFVVMSNHQSHLDIPLLCHVVDGSMRFVAKQELFRVPIWGRAMRDAGMIVVDRGDRASAIESLRAAGRTMKERGIHVWIAPEGTRSRDGKLGAFKKGGFRLALETGRPILPVALDGTRAMLPPKHTNIRRGAKVRVVIGKPISVEGKTVEGLMEEVRGFLAPLVER